MTYSSAALRQFAWKQVTSWGTNIPNMQIKITNVATNNVELTDTTALAASGTWEYSTNGTSWLAWDNTKDTVGYYIRYTAASLPSNITVRVLLTQV